MNPASHVRLRIASLVSTIAIGVGGASAAVPDHPSVRVEPVPSWVEVATIDPTGGDWEREAASSSVASLLVDFQARVADDDTTEYSSFVYRVLTSAGLGIAAETEISFDPGFQQLVLHHVRLFRDGRWHDRLDQAQVTIAQRESDFSRRIYDGSLSVLVVLGDVRVGDVVDYAYSIEGFNPVFDGHYFTSLSMAWSSPVQARNVRILVPADGPLLTRGYGDREATAAIDELDGFTEFLWQQFGVPAIPYEGSTPPSWETYPWLQISQFGSWAEVVDWALPRYQVAAADRPAVRAKAEEFAADSRDPAEQAMAATRWVQDELRYFAMVLGPNSHAPHPPNLTLERRFGDCKDKSLLLVTLLDELGITAWPALIDSTSGILLPTRLPSPGVFDHVVVVAEIDGEEVWIDPTISFQGGRFDATSFPDYGYALVIRDGETELTKIPERQTAPGLVSARYVYDFADDGATATVEITTEFEGAEADNTRYDFADTSLDELQDGYVSFYSTASGVVKALSPLEVSDDRLANRIVTQERYSLEDWWTSDEDGLSFDLLPLLLVSILDTGELTERHAPLDLPKRMHRSETVSINAPADWQLEGVDAEIGDPWFDFRAASRRETGVLEIDYELGIGDMPVDPAEIATFNRAVEAVNDAAYYSITTGGDASTDTIAATIVALAVVGAAAALICLVLGWLLVRWRLV